MSLLGSSTAPREAVFRHGSLPKTIIEGDVVWEELGSQGHDMEPAILTVPPGKDSGGAYSRPGEIFAYVLEGTFSFSVTIGEPREFELMAGDSITAPPRTVIEWRNIGPEIVRAVWIENLVATGYSR
jgi:quercetin dioxygenase-like cupin family protein